MKIASLGIAAALIIAAGAASAQIAMYEHDNYGGRVVRASNSIANLSETGFNDKASSAVIRGGNWQLCVDSYFRGSCITLGPGEYRSLSAMGLNDKLSSVRELGWTPDGGGGWNGGNPNNGYNNNYNNGGGDGNWGGGSRAVLYEGYNLTGRMFVIGPRGISAMGNTGFNDKASSLRIESGYWLFCSDANFEGECRTFGPGDYPSLPSGLNNRISSGRRVSQDYPYRQNPSWGN